MMKMSLRNGIAIGIVLALLSLGACSNDEEKISAPEQESKPATDIWEPQKQQIEKAKAVEQQILDADEQRRKDMEKMGL
jgi:hypothetical protein